MNDYEKRAIPHYCPQCAWVHDALNYLTYISLNKYYTFLFEIYCVVIVNLIDHDTPYAVPLL